MTQTILVSEIFGPTIQGEGGLIGSPTVFVRTAGCDYRCTWCDTLYAVLPEHRTTWYRMSADEVLDRVMSLSGQKPILVTLSGGNPALQPLDIVIDKGHGLGLTFALETQGSVVKPWFEKLDYLVVSPKPPSSGEQTDWDRLASAIARAGTTTQTTLKVVVFDDLDYAYARQVMLKHPDVDLILQVGNPQPPHLSDEIDIDGLLRRYEWLANKVASDGWYRVRVLPQLHTLVWGNTRGV